MLILGEPNVSRTNSLQSSNILPLKGFVIMGGRSLGFAGPVADLLTGAEFSEGTVDSSRCHNLGVPQMSFATTRSPSSLPPISSRMPDRVRSGNDGENDARTFKNNSLSWYPEVAECPFFIF